MGASTMEQTTNETALVRPGARLLIKSQELYTQVLQQWQQEQVHALCPVVDFGALPEQFALVPAKVKLSPDPRDGDVYKGHFCKDGEVAPTAMGLQKIARCAGISLQQVRTDPRTIPNYWEVKAIGTWTGLDGTKESREATKEWDLRDGSENLKGFTPKQISEALKHGLRNAETRAISAVIRQLGIKQKFTVAELAKPFGLVRVVFQPDMKDPVQRAIVTQQAIGGAMAFAHPGAALPPAPPSVIDAQVVDEPRSRASAPEPAFESVAADAPPPEEPAGAPQRYAVTKVQKVDGAERYFVFTEQTKDQRLITDDGQLARTAVSAKGQGPIVELDLERRGEESWILELKLVPKTEAASASDQVPPVGTCFVEKIDEKTGERNGRTWRRRTITFSTGEFGVTFSDTIAKDAEEARTKRLPVKIQLEDNPSYPDQQDLKALTLVDTRQSSFLESEL